MTMAETQGILARSSPSPVMCPLGEACAAAFEGEAGRPNRLLADQPAAADLHSRLGVLLTREGHFAAAVTHLRRAAEIGPDTVSVRNNLGIALARLGDLSEAVASYQ